MHTYVQNRDDVMYHKLTDAIKREFLRTQRESCRRNVNMAKLSQYVSRLEPSTSSFSFGSNVFATTSGEVFFYLSCRTTVVRALEAQHCFDALPVVEVRSRKLEPNITIETDDGGFDEKTGFPKLFLEPLTHRLVTVANIVPCTWPLYAMYRDVQGRWVEVTPRLVKTLTKPDVQQIDVLSKLEYESSINPTFSTRAMGIYSERDLELMAEHLEFPRLQHALVHRLASQSAGLTPGEYIDPSIVFPDHVLPYGNWAGFVLGPIFAWFKKMGMITSVALFVFYTLKLVWFVWHSLMSCSHFYSVHGWSKHLIMSLCPAIYLTRDLRNKHKISQRIETEMPVRLTRRELKLSSYEPSRRFDIPQERYFQRPEDPTQSEIDLGTLKAAYDQHHNRPITIRDEMLAAYPTAPLIINDLPGATSSVISSIYPRVPIYRSRSNNTDVNNGNNDNKEYEEIERAPTDKK